MLRPLLLLAALGLGTQAARAETPMPGPEFGLGTLAPDPRRTDAGQDAAAGSVTFTGNGRFGLLHEDDETSVSSRLRMNLDANRVTDGGLVVGGRLRMQQENGSNGAGLNAGKLYLSFPAP